MAAEKQTHKTNGEHNGRPRRPISPGTIERYMRIYDLEANVLTQGQWSAEEQKIKGSHDTKGGIVFYARVPQGIEVEDVVTAQAKKGFGKGKAKEQFVAVRVLKGMDWVFPQGRQRTAKDDAIGLHTSVKPITAATYQPESGVELETAVQGTLQVSKELESALKPLGAAPTPEYMAWTLEVAFGHSADHLQQAKTDLKALKLVDQEAQAQEKHLLPVSMWPFDITKEDARNHPYILGMQDAIGVPNLSIYGPSQSLQVMMENRGLEQGREAYNKWSQIAHLLKAWSHASPVAYGRLYPNMKDIIEERQQNGAKIALSDEWLQYIDFDTPLSTRQAARTFGSTFGGGVATEDLPVPAQEYYSTLEHIIIDQKTPTPDRVGGKNKEGHHLDMRYRRTIGEKSANELANLDTFAGDPIKITAVKTVANRLNMLFNLMSADELAATGLFKKNLKKADYDRLRKESFAVDNVGVDALIETPTGNHVSAGEQGEKLLELIAAGYKDTKRGISIPPLPQDIVAEIRRSIQVPTAEDFRKAEGTEIRFKSNGEEVVVPSLAGWYGTQGSPTRGIGTAAHWQRARIAALHQLGYTEKNIMEDYMTDMETNFRERLKNVTESDLDRLFEPSNVTLRRIFVS